jgi:hypothetical protein
MRVEEQQLELRDDDTQIRRRLESLGRRADGALADSALLSTRAFGATLEVHCNHSTKTIIDGRVPRLLSL